MPNLVRQRYDALSSNYVICIDITSVGDYGYLFIAIDLASRCVVGHCYSLAPFDVPLICEVLTEIIRKRSFLPGINIIHSDRESIFSNIIFISFLEEKNIGVSRGSSKAHENQVIERLNRTIKGRIRSSLDPTWSTLKKEGKPWDPFLSLERLSVAEFEVIVKKEIEEYNDRPHSYFDRQASPNDMEEALFAQYSDGTPLPSSSIPFLSASNSSESLEMEAYKKEVLSVYQGDWASFFHQWRLEQKDWQEKTTQELLEAKARYESLYDQYLKVQAQLEELYQESLRRKAEDAAKEALRLKRKSAKKQPLRATISLEEFTGILKLVTGRSADVKSRRRLSLALLFLTGLRVSNLLVLTVLNVLELFNDGSTTIRLIKGGESRHKLVLTSEGRSFLKSFRSDFNRLYYTKIGSDLLFSSPEDSTLPFNHELFDRELNKILSKASVIYGKHLRTHSFRATFITDLLESVQIDEVKELVGHKSIATTLEYKRSRLSTTQRKDLLKTRDSFLNPKKKNSVKDVNSADEN